MYPWVFKLKAALKAWEVIPERSSGDMQLRKTLCGICKDRKAEGSVDNGRCRAVIPRKPQTLQRSTGIWIDRQDVGNVTSG
jgi:hypothetical protein